MSAAFPVSICLVTYNRAELLPRTLNSILGQSFSNFELIISDDCSTDRTEDICRDYARQDLRIRYLRNMANLGMPGNLNASLVSASGNYVANLHDGDVYRGDLIARWKQALDQYPQAGFVFNSYRVISENGEESIFKEKYPPLISGREVGQRLLSRWDSCVFGTVMARRIIYEKMGWFDPRFGSHSDIDMWLRIAREYDVAYVNEPLIDLMPKDQGRFYGFVHWKVLFWVLGIHTINLQRYRHVLPEITCQLSKKYRRRRREYLMRHMAICFKHRRWDRVKEGLAIWRDADDLILKAIGHVLGRSEDAPMWYNEQFWGVGDIPPQNPSELK